jgi:hypothetical protein
VRRAGHHHNIGFQIVNATIAITPKPLASRANRTFPPYGFMDSGLAAYAAPGMTECRSSALVALA